MQPAPAPKPSRVELMSGIHLLGAAGILLIMAFSLARENVFAKVFFFVVSLVCAIMSLRSLAKAKRLNREEEEAEASSTEDSISESEPSS
jgi:predicted membrane channel-forming protein YqfA (hemolysin III family)